ncbi:major facilitator superfamily domain-containing protein [Aspergillus pseudodeflectus]|uniref:Major facilitator superfamily domain-containing protein n=1 Tax=Aspergillus pseudodeflectus TaxID=176178 RepID=A0ABR4K459_9EURO
MEKAAADIEQPAAQPETSDFITGWRLAILLLSVSIAIFLPNLEVSIVSTALVTITNDLQGFSKTGWVVVAYLVTYTGFIIIWAKLSDILTRKWSLIASLVVFIVGSAICGASQSMTMLIVFRALQGLGGAGCFSISMVVFFEMIPPAKYPKYGSLLSADVALATLLGPIIGGAIADGTSWRWVFLLNLPIGALAVVALLVFLPKNFPNHGSRPKPPNSKHSLQRVDFIGTLLLVGANLLLVTALLEASTDYSWSSALTISLLTISAVLWICFVVWEYFATRETWPVEPVFPFRFFPNRYWMGMLLQSFFLGVPFTMLVIALPQRFQTVNSMSALDAGVRLLPYAMLAPVGSLVSNIIFMRRPVPIPLLIAGATFQVLGLALLVAEPVRESLPAQLYGYETLAGFGVGITFGTLVTITPSSVEPRDLATATGAMIQFRQMGSTIGLSIGSALLNSYIKSHLAPPVLSASQLESLLENIRVIFTLPPELQQVTREVFAAAFELQLKVVIGLAAALFPSILLMLRVTRRDGGILPAGTGAR